MNDRSGSFEAGSRCPRTSTTAGIEEKMKPVLRFVRKLIKIPWKMVQADAAAILEAGGVNMSITMPS